MTGELHETSAAIGELRAEVRASAEHRAELKRAIDAVGVKIDAVAAALTPLSGLQARVDALETEAVERSHARARAAGFIAGVSAIGGVAGSMLTWAAAKFGIH